MKRVFNNQKGYSLVELLVAMAIFAIVLTQIFAMMQHSARLYKNGTYEVDLQTEAQQFVQQMEELLIDVNVSVNETGTPSSNYTIQIINTDQTYTVTFVKDDPAADFGVVRMSASGNIAAADMPMAEYVQSVSLDMAEYTSADKVVLCVSMNNGQYSYETCKDIYLRNGVGSGRGGAMNVPEGDFDEELDVLRFKTYNLTDLYQVEDKTLDFRFEDGNTENADYYIYQSVGGWYLRCKTSLTSHTGWSRDSILDGFEYNIFAVDHDNPSSAPLLKIRIRTREVKVLPEGYGIAFVYTSSDETGGLNAVQVQGIDMTAATSAEWRMYWHRPTGGDLEGNLYTAPVLEWPGSSDPTPGIANRNTDPALIQPVKDDMGGGNEIRFDRLSVKIANIDDSSFGYNGLMVKADGASASYKDALMQGKGYYMNVRFHFPGVSETFNVNIFFAPSSTTALPEAVMDKFWEMCFPASF